jgi:hypothetical protein
MLGQVQLDVAFQSRQNKTATPSFAFAVRDRSPDGSTRGKEEEVDMRIRL